MQANSVNSKNMIVNYKGHSKGTQCEPPHKLPCKALSQQCSLAAVGGNKNPHTPRKEVEKVQTKKLGVWGILSASVVSSS
jgi:hypothetical protein